MSEKVVTYDCTIRGDCKLYREGKNGSCTGTYKHDECNRRNIYAISTNYNNGLFVCNELVKELNHAENSVFLGGVE